MTRIVLAVSISLALLMCLSATAQDNGEIPGYRDSPMVPGTQWHKHDPDRPRPRVVTTAQDDAPPSDAVVLFGLGGDLSQFEPSQWSVQNSVIVAGGGQLISKQPFGDMQLHIEWRGPDQQMSEWGNQGNNGVRPMGMYEIQIFDSHSTKIYADGQAGAVYGETPPMVNVTRPRGRWQSFDIIFKAPVFDGDKAVSPPRVTVFQNGVLIQYNTEILGRITHWNIIPLSPHVDKLPLVLDGHHCPVEFRNIWVRELKLP